MKTVAFQLALSLLFLFTTGAYGGEQRAPESSSGKNGPKPAEPSIAIYLFAEDVEWQEARKTWKARPLFVWPLISESDIISYDFTHHKMSITADAFARYTNATFRKLVVPFVMVAEGERIYLGSFVSSFCSASIPMPSVVSGRPPVVEEMEWILVIDRNYAAPVEPGETDPRMDERIKRVFSRLGKLR